MSDPTQQPAAAPPRTPSSVTPASHVAAGSSAHPAPGQDPTLGKLVNDLTTQVPELIRSELQLAQAELAQKGKQVGAGLGAFGAAGVVALYGAGALVATAIIALALVVPTWLSALIVTVVLFLVAGVLALTGKKAVDKGTPPEAGEGSGRSAGEHRHREGTALVTNQTPEQIQADIERQREALASTVDQLTDKLDVKSRAGDKAAELKDRATTDDGKPRPEVLGAAAGVVVAVALLVWWRSRRAT